MALGQTSKMPRRSSMASSRPGIGRRVLSSAIRAPVRCCSSSSTTTTTTTVSEPRFATVSVDVGYATEQATVQLTHPDSCLVEATMQFPLGLVLENVDGQVVVTEVTKQSSAAAANCRVGDVVRATTAFTMQMTYPTVNLLFGGVGRPKLVKILLPTDKAAFTKVMDAVRSNSESQGGDGTITLVLERIGGSSSSTVNSNGSSSGNGSSSNGSRNGNSTKAREGEASAAEGEAVGRKGAERTSAVFDPQIFE